jgi:alkylhydroperoxidase/carboxymuconolactone decarboxylase family protein YurZ
LSLRLFLSSPAEGDKALTGLEPRQWLGVAASLVCNLLINRQGSCDGQERIRCVPRGGPGGCGAYDGFVKALAASKGIDEKNKHLVYIALNAAASNPGAVLAHVPMAKKLGASRDEICDAVLMTLTVVGLKGVTACLADALAAYDD